MDVAEPSAWFMDGPVTRPPHGTVLKREASGPAAAGFSFFTCADYGLGQALQFEADL